jgi:hypothetical protein
LEYLYEENFSPSSLASQKLKKCPLSFRLKLGDEGQGGETTVGGTTKRTMQVNEIGIGSI